MNPNPRRPSEAGLSTYTTLDDTARSPGISVPSSRSTRQDAPLSQSKSPTSPDTLNQYRMRLPHQLATGLNPSAYTSSTSQRPSVRTAPSNTGSLPSTLLSTTTSLGNQNAQVKDLVAKFSQAQDNSAAYAPRKYSRTASGHSAATAYRPSSSSSRAPSEAKSAGTADTAFDNISDPSAQAAKTPTETTYKPYRTADTFYISDDQESPSDLYTSDSLSRNASREQADVARTLHQRPSESLLNVPGGLSSRYRAAPSSNIATRPGGFETTRAYSSERYTAREAGHQSASDRQFNDTSHQDAGVAGHYTAPITAFEPYSTSVTPIHASPKSRPPTRTAYSASVSRRGSFMAGSNEARRRPVTPDAHTSSGTVEHPSRPTSRQRKSPSTSMFSKLITPPRSSRSAGYAGMQSSGSPRQPTYQTSSATTTVPPSPKLERPNLSPRSNSENLLTQLSRAVSPPRLRLDLHGAHDVSLSGPTTGGTDFEDDEFRLDVPGHRGLSPSREARDAAHVQRTMGHHRVASSGSMQNTSGVTEPSANASKVLDKIMVLRQRSSQLLSDVFQHSHSAAELPTSTRSDHSDRVDLQQGESHHDIRAFPESDRWHTKSALPGQPPNTARYAQDRAVSPEAHMGIMTPPHRPFSSAMSAQSGRMTLDSDSYSVINRVLDQYHETGIVSPDMVYTFQQHILETDPELSTRDDIDSLTIAKAALEDLVKDHSQSSLFKAHSQSSFFGNSPAKSSSSHQLGTHHDLGSSADPLGIHSLSQSDYNRNQTPLESPTQPGSGRGTTLRLRHYSNANQLVSPYESNNTQTMNQDNEDIGPTPPPKDLQYSRLGRVDNRLIDGHAQPREMHASTSRGPMLPEIQSTGGGLGFTMARNSHDLKQNSGRNDPPQIQPSNASNVSRRTNGPPASPSLRVQPAATTQASTPPSEGVRAFSSKPSLELTGHIRGSPASSFDRAGSATVPDLRSSDSAANEDAATSAGTSTVPEDPRLIKRRHIVKELVDTEFSFNQDMKVIEDIYKGTASAVEALTPDDRRILFGNSAQIVEFSEAFLDTLKQAAASVYVMPRTNKWRIKRGSVTIETAENHETALVTDPSASDEEKDRKTTIGGAFGQYLSKMERVYGDYLRNHDLANQRLARLQSVPQVSLWLNECHTYASDITTAWDLDSLLVKPVQRILKYPLLLKTLLDATPADHPDYSALAIAMKQMTDISVRINESKKRAELLDQAVNRPNRKKEFDVSSGLSRAFGRRSEKLRQQVGMADAVEDFEYKAIAEKFGGQLFQLQVVMRDMEMYKKSVEDFIRQYSRIIEVIETMIELGPSTAPKTESKWRKFAMTIREMTAIIYVDHDNAIKKHCIEPIIALIKLHEKPQSLMAQRKKRLPEYAKFVLTKNKGEKLDKKTKQQGEEFIALNDTLKDELPKLFALNAKLVETCLKNYVDIQAHWQLNWERKIGNVLKDQQPADFASIIEAFHNDFAYTEAQVLALNVCNGSLLADAAAFQSPTASTVFGTDDASSLKRPSLMASQRSESVAGNSPVIPEPDFLKHRSNGSFQMSLYSNRASLEPAMPSPSRNSSSTQLGASVLNSFPPSAATNKTRRHRSGSASSSIHSVRSPITPQLPLLSRNSSAQTVAFGPYQANDRSTARSSNPGPASPTQTRSPLMSRFSQNSTRSTRASSFTKSPEITFHAASSPTVQSPAITRTRSSSYAQQTHPSSAAPDPHVRPSRPRPSHQATTTVSTARGPQEFPVIFLAASLFEFNIDRSRKEAGYPYLTYVPGEIFDVIGEKGELWLAKNQDDQTGLVGWIWEKHFAKLVPDAGGNVRHAAAAAVASV